MIHVPKRTPKTPEVIEQVREMELVRGVFNRMLAKTTQPGDEFLMLKYADELKSLQDQFDRFYFRKYG